MGKQRTGARLQAYASLGYVWAKANEKRKRETWKAIGQWALAGEASTIATAVTIHPLRGSGGWIGVAKMKSQVAVT